MLYRNSGLVNGFLNVHIRYLGVAGLVSMSIISGLLMSRTGYYVPFSVLGGIIGIIGTALLSTWTTDTSRPMQYGYLFVFGVGVGLNIQTRIIALQNSVQPHQISVATGLGSRLTLS